MRNNSIEWKHRNIKLNIDLGKTLKLSWHFWLFVEWVCLFGLLYFSILFSFCCCFIIFFVFTFLECFSYFMRSPRKRYGQETKKNKSSKDKSKEQNRRKLVYPVIKNHYACNSIQSKRRVRETISKSARNEEEEKNGRHFTFTTVRFCFFFLHVILYACILRSLSLYWWLFTRGNIRCVCFFSAFISLCVSVGLL